MKVIKVYVNTGFSGVKHEDEMPLPDDWESMTEEEQQAYLEVVAEDFLMNCVECGAFIAEV